MPKWNRKKEDRYVQISGFGGTTGTTFENDCLNPKYHKNIRYFKDTSGKTVGYMLDCYIVSVNVQFYCLATGQTVSRAGPHNVMIGNRSKRKQLLIGQQ